MLSPKAKEACNEHADWKHLEQLHSNYLLGAAVPFWLRSVAYRGKSRKYAGQFITAGSRAASAIARSVLQSRTSGV